MAAFNFVRASFYRDSVTLMRLAGAMEAVAGVTRAAAMMGTPANRALLEQAGLLAKDGAAAGAARAAAEQTLLARPPAVRGAETTPRTLEGALRALPGANLVLISVPGAYAGAEALRALRAGLHVMLFSDNVPVATEVELKRLARERGRFLLGPDCGTAILDGVPLGFANVVPRGRIGLAAASGTGLQEVTCAIARLGEGVSQAIGVGGRDLSDEVGGLMMLRALEALGADAATEVVCVIGKPPGRATALRLAEAVGALGKPCVVNVTGETLARAPWHAAATLEDAARAAVALTRGDKPAAVEFTRPAPEIERLVAEAVHGLAPGGRAVRGMYAGGTLAWEARGLLAARLGDVAPGVTGAPASIASWTSERTRSPSADRTR